MRQANINNRNNNEAIRKCNYSSALQSFQLRAHIFQGQFEPGMDASALLDPFVHVTFLGHTLTTSVSEC